MKVLIKIMLARGPEPSIFCLVTALRTNIFWPARSENWNFMPLEGRDVQFSKMITHHHLNLRNMDLRREYFWTFLLLRSCSWRYKDFLMKMWKTLFENNTKGTFSVSPDVIRLQTLQGRDMVCLVNSLRGSHSGNGKYLQ